MRKPRNSSNPPALISRRQAHARFEALGEEFTRRRLSRVGLSVHQWEEHRKTAFKKYGERYAERLNELVDDVREVQRGLDQILADDVHNSWAVQTLRCRGGDTPDFDHFTRAFIERISLEFGPDLVLWFAGFPMTGQIAIHPSPKEARSTECQLILETTLIWRATSSAVFEEATKWLEAISKSGSSPKGEELRWLQAWAKQQEELATPAGKVAWFGGTSWESVGVDLDPPALPPVADDGDSSRQADDLFIATGDRVYLLRKDEYTPSSKSTPEDVQKEVEAIPVRFYQNGRSIDERTALLTRSYVSKLQRKAETQLAERMISSGVDLAAIPSTGLPTRGTWCYLVNLTD